MGLEWNDDGLEELQRQLQKKLRTGSNVPLGGSEAEAIHLVKDQLTGIGLTPNDADIEQWVRDLRQR
jgi:hypothetical protein